MTASPALSCLSTKVRKNLRFVHKEGRAGVSPAVLEVKNPSAYAGDKETQVRSLGQEDLQEKGRAGDARDGGSIPGLGRSPGVEDGNPLQYSCLEKSMD